MFNIDEHEGEDTRFYMMSGCIKKNLLRKIYGEN